MQKKTPIGDKQLTVLAWIKAKPGMLESKPKLKTL